MAPPMIMVVAENMDVQQAFASALGPSGLAPIVAFTLQEAMAILIRHRVSLIFCSDELPNDGLGVVIRQSSRLSSPVPVAVVSRQDNWERYLDFLHRGAFDYVLYPMTRGEIERVIVNMESARATSMVQGTPHMGARALPANAPPLYRRR